jgi:hypothetical protein
MASTTKTTTYAQAGYQAMANAFGNMINGTVSGGAYASLSPSASAVLLLAKIPPQAKHLRIQWNAVHTDSTGAKLQFGVKSADSVTASALVALTDIAVTTTTAWAVSAVYDPTWDDSAGEQVKYVQCSLGSGTISAGFVLNYVITYDFQNF